MRRLIAALAFLVLSSAAALAQSSCQYIVPGAVLTPAQWNYCFQQKTDLGSGYLPITGGTLSGELVTAGSTTFSAGFNLPPGSPPTSPQNGDLWVTPTGLFARVNGLTIQLNAGTVASATGGQIAWYASSGSTISGNAALTYSAGAVSAGTAGSVVGSYCVFNLASGSICIAPPTGALGTVTVTLPDATTNLAGLSTLTSGTIYKSGGTANLAASSISDNGAKVSITSEGFGLTGNQSAAAWTTNGIRYANVAATLTDTTSSGTVAAAYTSVFGGDTIAASSAATFTNYYGSYFKVPVAGTNVTFTNKWALGADSLIVAGAAAFTGLSSGTCANSLTLNAGNQVVLAACPGSATSVAIGSTGVTGAINGNILYNNAGLLGQAATTGSYGAVVLSQAPSINNLTVGASFTATGLVTNADLVNSSVTVAGAGCTLGSSCSLAASNLSNGVTGSGPVVLQVSPTFGGQIIDNQAGNGTYKGAQFGSANGSYTSPTQLNTNILLYDNTGANWAGVGSDTGGRPYIASGIGAQIVFASSAYFSCTSLNTNSNGVIGCATSALRLKDPVGTIGEEEADLGLDQLRAAVWRYKDPERYGEGVFVGLYADDVEKMDPRCVVFDGEGRLNGYRDQCILAYLVADRDRMKKQITALEWRLARRR